MNRRELLKIGLVSGAAWLTRLEPSFASSTRLPRERRLVVVMLLGGADPLSLFPPVEDDEYYKQRPNLAVKRDSATLLAGPFALHKLLSPLEPLWKTGEMGVIHQFGLPLPDLSHANAKNFMDKGVAPGAILPTDGFLNRAMIEKYGSEANPLHAISVQSSFPAILEGAAPCLGFGSIDQMMMDADSAERLGLFTSGKVKDLKKFGQVVAKAAKQLNEIFPHSTKRREVYDSRAMQLDFQLGEIARLINAGIGVRVAVTSTFGWDSHAAQDLMIEPKMSSLARDLVAFRKQLQEKNNWRDTTVIVVSEFGRAVRQNGALGSDHGFGSAAILLGGNLKEAVRGKVLHDWKPLKTENLFEERSLDVHHDYRNVFGDLLVSHLGLTEKNLKKVFPGHTYKSIGV